MKYLLQEIFKSKISFNCFNFQNYFLKTTITTRNNKISSEKKVVKANSNSKYAKKPNPLNTDAVKELMIVPLKLDI